MTVCCKLAYRNNSNLNGFDYMIVRATSMALMSALQVGYLRLNVFDIKKGYRTKLLIRCLAGGFGMPCYFMALKYIPASKGALIFNIHPLFVAVLAYFLLKESITKMKIFTVVGAFIGVAIFAQSKNDPTVASDSYYFGICLVAVSC